jgi:ligand-binding sensor domain-containing protein
LWVGTDGLGLIKWDIDDGSFVQYTWEDGLASNQVTSIAVDGYGNKWIGTRWSGVSRFDGLIWTTFTTANSGLTSNSISVIKVDNSGNVWFGAGPWDGKLFRFDGSVWTEYTPWNSDLPGGQAVVAIAFEGSDVWIGVQPYEGEFEPAPDSGGLARLSGNDWYTYTSVNSQLTSNSVRAIAVDLQGNKWVGTDAGLNKLTSGGSWESYDLGNSLIADDHVRAVAADGDGTIWVGTEKGVNKVVGTSWTQFNASNSGLVNDQIRAIEAGEDGSVWFGTVNGVSRLTNSTFTTYSPHNWELSDYPRTVAADFQTGEIWVGTYDGLDLFRQADTKWYSFVKPWGSSYVKEIAVADNGDVWVGTQEDLSVLPSAERVWLTFNSDNSDLPSGEVTDILLHPNGDVWASTTSGSVTVLKAGNATWDVYSMDDIGLVSDYIYDIEVDQTGTLWLGARGTWVIDGSNGHWEGGGLCSFDDANWTCYTTENSDIGAHNIYAVAIGKDGSVWLGTDDWVRRLKDDSWMRFDHDNSSLASSQINDIYVDRAGKLWFATEGGGIALYDGGSWSFYRTCNTDLDFDDIEKVCVDKDGDLLAMTWSTLWKYSAVRRGEVKALSPNYIPGYSVFLYAYLESTANVGYPSRSDVTVQIEGEGVRLYDDGTHGDLEPGDGYYSNWYQGDDSGVRMMDLYVGNVKLDALTLSPVANPQLVVLTDIKALYSEFIDTGTAIGEDLDVNSRVDIYDLLDRLSEYVRVHGGSVVSLSDAITLTGGYPTDYSQLDYGQDTATRLQMGHLVDQLIENLNTETSNSIQDVVLVGDDEVVPFYRVFDPTDFFGVFNENYPDYLSRERGYPDEIGGTQGNATLMDSSAGYILSDVPYGIRTHQVITMGTWLSMFPDLPRWATYPEPDMGVGRVFSAHPEQLIAAIERYETPLYLTPDYADAALFVAQGDKVDFPILVERSLFPQIQDWFGDRLQVYDRSANLWVPAQFATAVEQNNLVSWWGHATHRTFGIDGSSDIDFRDLNTIATTQPIALIGFGCHLGYSVSRYPNGGGPVYHYARALLNPFLAQGVTYFAPSSQAYVWGSQFQTSNLHELVIAQFINRLTNYTNPTVGDVWQDTLRMYHSNDPALVENDNPATHLFHITGAYGNVLYGLPTQPIERVETSSVRVSYPPQRQTARQAVEATVIPAIDVDVPHFQIETLSDGTTLFSVPNGGTHLAPTNGPALPLVIRSLTLPENVLVTDVRLVETESEAYAQPVTLARAQFETANGDVVTGTYDLPPVYPENLYRYRISQTDEGEKLILSVVPMQYNRDSHQVTLYTHLRFNVEYIISAPPTGPQLDSVVVNEGQPVRINQAGQGVRAEVVYDQSENVQLMWSVQTPNGFVVESGNTPVHVISGTTVVNIPLDTVGWPPGSKDLTVYLVHEGQISDSENIALQVEGLGLYDLDPKQHVYPPNATEAVWRVSIRDEFGAPVSDLGGTAGPIWVTVDGQVTDAEVQEVNPGEHHIRLLLSIENEGMHIVRISATDSRGITGWREWRLTKQVYRIYLPIVTKDA